MKRFRSFIENILFNNMSANSDWMKAYEAQKAKALERLSAAKSGSLKETNVSGLSGLIPSKTPVSLPSKNSTSSSLVSQLHGNTKQVII